MQWNVNSRRKLRTEAYLPPTSLLKTMGNAAVIILLDYRCGMQLTVCLIPG